LGIRYAVAQEDGAGARPHDDAAVDAVVDLHLVRVRVRVRVRVKVRLGLGLGLGLGFGLVLG
jgi:hypothetical protein